MMNHVQQRSIIDKVVARLQREGYYGNLVLQFREGNWVLARHEQTSLPEAIAKGGVTLLTLPGDTRDGEKAHGGS